MRRVIFDFDERGEVVDVCVVCKSEVDELFILEVVKCWTDAHAAYLKLAIITKLIKVPHCHFLTKFMCHLWPGNVHHFNV